MTTKTPCLPGKKHCHVFPSPPPGKDKILGKCKWCGDEEWRETWGPDYWGDITINPAKAFYGKRPGIPPWQKGTEASRLKRQQEREGGE